MKCNPVLVFQEEHDIPEVPVDNQNLTPLPILYTEDGAVILRFSEIFGINKPSKKSEKRECRYFVPKGNIFFILKYKCLPISTWLSSEPYIMFWWFSGILFASPICAQKHFTWKETQSK